jgi:putative ABC transport system permease protein
MLLYNARLAWKSLRRNPVLSILIIAGIALGVAVSTTFVTVWHVLALDPIPGRSDKLFYVRMDSWDPTSPFSDRRPGPPDLMTYQDVSRILKSDIPTRQAAMFESGLYVYPPDAKQRPFREQVRATSGDFFPMFDVPFRYGSGWDRAADAKPENVVVIGSELNDKLFGGGNSVGRTLRLGDRDFRVAGVLAPWQPKVRFYDMTGDPNAETEQVYIPLRQVEPMDLAVNGTVLTWKGGNYATPAERLASSEEVWLQTWVQLDNETQKRQYHQFLDAYARDQKKIGRFQRPLDNRLTTVPELMAEWEVVPSQARALAVISMLFLAVSALNLIGLFLGKFLARASTVGVRRALGASRRAIFLQHLVECEVVGLIGGVLGLLLSFGTLAVVNKLYEPVSGRASFFHLDGRMVLAAIVFSLLAGAVAGVYPAWRICSIPPARHLKEQ